MPQSGHYCPFLNRADARCSTNFSLDRLEHAFGYCFDGYDHCPLYVELLVERRVRRLSAACVHGSCADDAKPLVQITFPDRHRLHAA